LKEIDCVKRIEEKKLKDVYFREDKVTQIMKSVKLQRGHTFIKGLQITDKIMLAGLNALSQFR